MTHIRNVAFYFIALILLLASVLLAGGIAAAVVGYIISFSHGLIGGLVVTCIIQTTFLSYVFLLRRPGNFIWAWQEFFIALSSAVILFLMIFYLNLLAGLILSMPVLIGRMIVLRLVEHRPNSTQTT